MLCARCTSSTWSSTAPRPDPPTARPPDRTSRWPRAGKGPATTGTSYSDLFARVALVEDALDLEGDRALLADGDAAAGNRAVVADAVVVPVDLGGGGERCPGAP